MTKTDVYSDFNNFRQKAGIEEWAAKFVDRKYAFEDQTVEKGESQWMKVVYGFDRKLKHLYTVTVLMTEPEIPMNSSGSTFSHVFGTNTSAFELLVVKRKIMGPCWLEIKEAGLSAKSVRLYDGSEAETNEQTTWCKIEFSVASPKLVNPVSESDPTAPKEVPPMTMMSLSLRSIVNHRENKTEILCATARTWEGCK